MTAILLSTFNGSKYIQEQLDSILEQSSKEFNLLVRDDSSTDNTSVFLISDVFKLMSSNENLGIQRSFNCLLEEALQDYNNSYFMFCDQDDVWENDKLEKTILKMKELEEKYPEQPILIHSDLKVVDENLNILDKSFWNYEKINPNINSLNRLLLQNTVTGCTVMINRELANLVTPIPKGSIMHDWWIGLVASYFGKIGFIEEPTILYRQHSKNDTGAKKLGFSVIFKNLISLTFMKKDKFLEKNILQAAAFLNTYRDQLDPKTIKMIEEFVDILDKPFLERKTTILKYKLLKQGLLRNIGLLLKV